MYSLLRKRCPQIEARYTSNLPKIVNHSWFLNFVGLYAPRRIITAFSQYFIPESPPLVNFANGSYLSSRSFQLSSMTPFSPSPAANIASIASSHILFFIPNTSPRTAARTNLTFSQGFLQNGVHSKLEAGTCSQKQLWDARARSQI